MVLCTGITKDGLSCKKNPRKGKTTCHHHKLNVIEIFTCNVTTTKDRSCLTKVDNEGDQCYYHKITVHKCGEPRSRGGLCKKIVNNEEDKCVYHGGLKKVKEERKDERTLIFCPGCGTEEQWKSMACVECSKYELSTLGRFYNVKSHKLFGIDVIPNSKGYISIQLSNDDGNKISKRTHTWQGIVFLDVKPIYGKEYSPISVDHIDGSTANNWICCNLRAATRSLQNFNRKIPKFNKGKTVLKVSLDEGKILEKFISINQAADRLQLHHDTMSKYCYEEKEFDGYKLRFFTKKDLEKQTWFSSENLYPEYQPCFEISTGGWIRRSNGNLTEGSFQGYHFNVTLNNVILNKKIRRYVHDLIYEIITDKKIPKELEISHLNTNGADNRFNNLELATHSKNMLRTVKLGKNRTAIKVKQLFHDETSKIFMSIGQAARLTETSSTSLKRVLAGETKSAGFCDCGLKYGWEKVID
uniref:HNH endonuclease n=1 Tax=Pithovirus LCPAC401 TaxID=2506595 RepID=A0A481ZA84_9VIRU|nr:MAG: HNH endonuclease [Pithovirus LCPAC401]